MTEMKYPFMRFGVMHLLLELCDYDYQREAWSIERASRVPNYIGVNEVMEHFVNDIDWHDTAWSSPKQLIGVALRNEQELEACQAVYNAIMALNEKKGWGLYPDEQYFEDPEWKNIIALSRHALRVMLQGDA